MEHLASIYSNSVLIDGPVDEIANQTLHCHKRKPLKNAGFTDLKISIDRLALPIYPIEVARKWLVRPGKNGKIHKFPVQTTLPKVQMTRLVERKQLPLDVEVERRRRQYAHVDLKGLLREVGMTMEEIGPTYQQYIEMPEKAFKHYLPLAFFDNSDLDDFAPEKWLQMGRVDDLMYPLPAKGFLPRNNNLLDFRWQYCAVTAYNDKTHLWSARGLSDECVYQVPKIQLMFLAEDPQMYVKRVQLAFKERNNAEAMIVMEAMVDCVVHEALINNSFEPNPKVDAVIAKITAKADKTISKNLRTEIYVIFEHLMTLYELESFVKMLPKEFPFFTSEVIRKSLPQKIISPFAVREIDLLKSLKLDIKETRYQVKRATLYYILAGIEAMMNVVIECQYVESLSLFICSFSKPLALADFLNVQQQNSTHVGNYLKNNWPTKLSAGICLVLRANGRGWLDISLDKWSVYMMCKISRFLFQVKLRMQESMQVMLETSIDRFVHFIVDPAKQFLDVQPDYVWKNDYINTEFPYVKPIFSMVIGISEDEKVFYSTDPTEFEPGLVEIFKKALEKTSGIRIIDAETMVNLRFAPNLYIMTVELIEDMYIIFNDLIQRCYSKAIIPLAAYGRKFERFIHFYLLRLTDYMVEYAEAKWPSMQVKSDILEYKRAKEELRVILPPSITIGPFHVIIDPLKQFMIKKYIEVVKRLFDYYIQRMFDINEALLERCLAIYNKIAQRPMSIEHLFEIRDFGVLVPDMVEQLKFDIQIMWLEYDLLDSFFYSLSDTQFAMKWNVYAWPQTIIQRLSTLREEQKVDIEEFRRLHLIECLGFQERLESLNDEIQAFSLIFDPNRVVETAVEVKKTWRIITDLQKLGETLRYRQELFEMDEFSLEFLTSIIDGFNPYRNLWGACSDFIKLEEATEGNPLSTIELDDVWESMEGIRRDLKESYELFHEKEEIAAVATVYLGRLDEFEIGFHCMKYLKNEYWLFMHWQELANRGGMEIKYSTAMNFKYCKGKGIMDHVDLVREISEKVEYEALEFRRALEEEERLRLKAIEDLALRKKMRKCRTDIM